MSAVELVQETLRVQIDLEVIYVPWWMNIVAITNLQVQLQTPNLIILSFKIISTFTFLSRNIFKNKSERQKTRQINATLST